VKGFTLPTHNNDLVGIDLRHRLRTLFPSPYSLSSSSQNKVRLGIQRRAGALRERRFPHRHGHGGIAVVGRQDERCAQHRTYSIYGSLTMAPGQSCDLRCCGAWSVLAVHETCEMVPGVCIASDANGAVRLMGCQATICSKELAVSATRRSCTFRRPLNSALLHWSSTEMQNRFYAPLYSIFPTLQIWYVVYVKVVSNTICFHNTYERVDKKP
jgi:hypothetical protein